MVLPLMPSGSQVRRLRTGTFSCWLTRMNIAGTYIAQTVWLSSWKFDRSIEGPMIDCTDSAYPGAVVIYMFYAAQYGMFQNMYDLLEFETNQTSLIVPNNI